MKSPGRKARGFWRCVYRLRPELPVQSDTHDVIGELHAAGAISKACRRWVEVGGIAEIDKEIFKLARQVLRELVLPATAHSTAGTGLRLLWRNGRAADIDFYTSVGETAGHIEQFGVHGAEGGTQAPPHCAKPPLPRLAGEGRVERRKVGYASAFVRPRQVRLQADQPRPIELIVAAERAADDSAADIEIAGDCSGRIVLW